MRIQSTSSTSWDLLFFKFTVFGAFALFPLQLFHVLALALQLWFVSGAAALCHFAPVLHSRVYLILLSLAVRLEGLGTGECNIQILGCRRDSVLSLWCF